MLGVSKTTQGLHFALYSHHATAVTVRLFHPGAIDPFLEKPLEKSGDIWATHLSDLPETFEYIYRCKGPYDPTKGHLFNQEMDLVDPYAKRLNKSPQWNDPKIPPRGVIAPENPFNWDQDARPMIPLEKLIVYEMHVRGFTHHKTSQAKHPGTFLGMIEKIPYLKELGINAVELLPVHTFNERENPKVNPQTGQRLFNYWGYSTENFFTLMNPYGTPEDFKTLVKELHRNNIEVILDVVYNHTSEGSSHEYYHSFRGIDNAVYYMVDEKGYFNYSGCGNTFNCNHPAVQQLILDSLRHFVTEYHVDGFRFDLASILTRGTDGHPLKNPPLIDKITRDPILGPTKLIAEAWDPGGLYQVGSFPSWKFGEWNDKFRDHMRHFIRGTGQKEEVKKRLLGSPDLFHTPTKSYNYITIHDGFSLRDLVSYNQKHNETNGEQNHDGMNDNVSWNCGEEGPTQNPEILLLREKQMRNAFVALLLSQGIPMLLMGDEYGHTKEGNNNAWCQDSALNYFLWDELEKNRDLFQMVSKLIEIRKRYLKEGKMCWYEGASEKFLAYLLDETLLVAFNPSESPLTWELPEKKWTRLIDTSLPLKETPLSDKTYTLHPYSSIVLIAT
ncbi:MAG: glycogen-debranching protein [Simkaniaceae bacterium]